MKAKQGLGERVKLVVLTLCDGFRDPVISFFTGMMIMSFICVRIVEGALK